MIDPFVLDASMAFVWLRPADDRPQDRLDLREILNQRSAVVSHLWRFEMLNILATFQRVGELTSAEVAIIANEAMQLTPYIADEGDAVTILTLAHEHGLTAYDASYLSICIRNGWPLASLDRKLLKAAAASGVELL